MSSTICVLGKSRERIKDHVVLVADRERERERERERGGERDRYETCRRARTPGRGVPRSSPRDAMLIIRAFRAARDSRYRMRHRNV